jgi:hypothetical protein
MKLICCARAEDIFNGTNICCEKEAFQIIVLTCWIIERLKFPVLLLIFFASD